MQVVIYNTERVNPFLGNLEDNLMDFDLHHKGMELVSKGLMRFEELQLAVKRAMNICRTSNINVRRHFKAVYISREGILLRDWRLSDLARKLVLINGDSNNEIVAQIQLGLLEEYHK